MVKLLEKFFIKNNQRNEYGLLAGVVGIVLNLLLFLFKLMVGFLSGSIAIVADSINNLSDGASSVVTVIGFGLASKPSDNEHPFGHARGEYVSGLIISIFIVSIGIQLIFSSVRKIFYPSEFVFSFYTIVILVFSVVVKLWLFRFNSYCGHKISSTTLLATARDSLNDVFVTGGILLSIFLSEFIGFNLDAYIGCFVAVFIICSGINLIKETSSPLLGEAPSESLVMCIKEKIIGYDGILEFHDLMIHSYGHAKIFCSLHAEVDANVDIMLSHQLIDNIERDFMDELGINMVIHLDPIVTDDVYTMEVRGILMNVVKSIDESLDFHDFRLIRTVSSTNLLFDLTVPYDFDIPSQKLAVMISGLMRGHSELFNCVITIDTNYMSTTIR